MVSTLAFVLSVAGIAAVNVPPAALASAVAAPVRSTPFGVEPGVRMNAFLEIPAGAVPDAGPTNAAANSVVGELTNGVALLAGAIKQGSMEAAEPAAISKAQDL